MSREVVIVGGGAAGMFAAVRAAELNPDLRVTVLENGRDLLQKVTISGGGRCNVTHDCRDPRDLVAHYPRGARELRGPLTRFGPQEMVDWLTARGVRLKTEADGRMFPVTDRSETVTGCLIDAARSAGVRMFTRRPVRRVINGDDHFTVTTADGESHRAQRLLIATGGMRGGGGQELARGLGHTVRPPVPSLFTFHIADPRLTDLAGLSVPDVHLRIDGARGLQNRGPVLVTHWGVSGPGVLKLSALGARELCARDYRFSLVVDWLPRFAREETAAELARLRAAGPRRRVAGDVLAGLPRRLWERLVTAAAIPPERTWAELRRAEARALVSQLREARFTVDGKSLNKDEFVTCGGVPLPEVDLRTMASRLVPGLFFAGEVLDIDGVTGGFNLQAAWTGGWLAGAAMAGG
jgi:hypothetical protein